MTPLPRSENILTVAENIIDLLDLVFCFCLKMVRKIGSFCMVTGVLLCINRGVALKRHINYCVLALEPSTRADHLLPPGVLQDNYTTQPPPGVSEDNYNNLRYTSRRGGLKMSRIVSQFIRCLRHPLYTGCLLTRHIDPSSHQVGRQVQRGSTYSGSN